MLSDDSNVGDSANNTPVKKTKPPAKDPPLGSQNENSSAANASTQEHSLKRKAPLNSVDEVSSVTKKTTPSTSSRTDTSRPSRTDVSTSNTTTTTTSAKTQSKPVPSSASTNVAESSASSASQPTPAEAPSSQMPPGNFAGSGSGSQPRYPSGVSSVSLSDLKKQRSEQRQVDVVDPYVQRRDNLEAQVQSMFLQSLQSDIMRPNTNSSILPSNGKKDKTNGHNNNNSVNAPPPTRAYMNDGQLRRYIAPNHAAVVGGDEDKTSCCVIM